MGYYNWGEQIGNSFMSMLAHNQQKKLDDARLSMEQQRLGFEEERLGLERKQWEDQQKTSEMNRSLLGLQIGDINAQNEFWKTMPNVDARFGDTNADNIVNQQDNVTSVSARYFPLVKDMAYSPYQTMDFVDNKPVSKEIYLPNYLAESQLTNAGNNYNAKSGYYFGQEGLKNDRAQLGISQANLGISQANLGINRQQADTANRLANLQYQTEVEKILNQSWDEFKGMVQVDQNGNLLAQTKKGKNKDGKTIVIGDRSENTSLLNKYLERTSYQTGIPIDRLKSSMAQIVINRNAPGYTNGIASPDEKPINPLRDLLFELSDASNLKALDGKGKVFSFNKDDKLVDSTGEFFQKDKLVTNNNKPITGKTELTNWANKNGYEITPLWGTSNRFYISKKKGGK
jgi:hypothetical protein